MKDSKYLLAYLAPAAGFAGVYFGGTWSFGAFYIGFVLIPLFELFLPVSRRNANAIVEDKKKASAYFDWLLYLNVPILFALIWFYLLRVQAGGLSSLESIGMALNVGLVVGTIGINVAHELGHRKNSIEQILSQALLLSALYMHFFIEHNRGHHKNVATPEDPASARKGEVLYLFWLRSITGSYANAWKLEAARMKNAGKSILHQDNLMIRFSLVQTAYLLFMGWMFGWALLVNVVAIALIGALLLESVNYIEHYGLRRKKLRNGRYESVQPIHSWNSNHELGRIFLYELTRHSDHHFKATRKYQTLRHFDNSPQLPLGYPGSILVALIPPVWFRLMRPPLARLEIN